MKKLILYGVLLLLSAFGLIFYTLSDVSREITDSDHGVFTKIGIDQIQSAPYSSFDKEIEAIRGVVSIAFKIAPKALGIEKNRAREPADLLELGHGNCFDRSRFLDKALRFKGFKTRYASIYGTEKTGSAFLSLISNDKSMVRSHALIEVKTSKGWMFVDTVSPFIALNADGKPVGLEDWQNVEDKAAFLWSKQLGGEVYPLMMSDYTYVYGLYSRHGRFYAPYIPVPDLSWAELLENI